MLQLQTLVDIPKPNFQVDYSSKLLLLGSCFSSNIGSRLERLKFNAVTNPFGVLYNPASISQSIDNLLNRDSFTEKEISFHNELYFSYYHHTSFSKVEKEGFLNAVNESFQVAKTHLLRTDVLFITLGTAWAYRLKSSKQIVANCHKIPAREFDRIFLTTEEITKLISQQLKQLLKLRPELKTVLTVSPIRHWKDGAIENTRSKSSLILAIKALEKLFPSIYYFPVYEIFMDELRDYRFYENDMLHPSGFAIDYIWQKFQKTFFGTNTIKLSEQVEKIKKSFEHRPVNTETESFKKFIKNLNNKALNLNKQHPEIDFSTELAQINSRFV